MKLHFPAVSEFLKGIFWTASARAFEWYKPRKRSYFRSKVINGFYRANSTWTYYSMRVNFSICVYLQFTKFIFIWHIHCLYRNQCVCVCFKMYLFIKSEVCLCAYMHTSLVKVINVFCFFACNLNIYFFFICI